MIFVFKTSVKNKRQIKELKPHLDTILPQAKWNFDITDIDKILRIECESDIVEIVIKLLSMQQFDCEELD